MCSKLFDGCALYAADKDLKQSLLSIPHARGILLFTDAQDKPVLLIIAADMRRLAQNRLETGDTAIATKRVKLSQITSSIYYKCCWCDFLCTLEHYRLAKVLFASRWTDVVTIAKTYFVKIDRNARWPSFTIAEKPLASGQTHVFGPFPNRRLAQEYIDILEQAFALCKQNCLIDSPDRALSCPYYQMNTCNAPCLGKISREQYLDQIDSAISAALGNTELARSEMHKLMRRHASDMNFEQAQAVKAQIEHLSKLGSPDFKWICELSKMLLLHIDFGPKISADNKKKKVQSFIAVLARYSGIARLADFTLEQLPQFIQALKAETQNFSSMPADAQTLSDELAIVSYSIYRSKSPGLWIDLRQGIEESEITRLIATLSDQPNVDTDLSVSS